MENFNKNEFDKQMNVIRIICLLIAIVGGLTLIGAVAATGNLNLSPDDYGDASYKLADYYGTYYWIDGNYDCWSLTVGLQECKAVRDSGAGVKEYYYYGRYVTSEHAHAVNPANGHEGREAIIIYKNDISDWTYTIWIPEYSDGVLTLDDRTAEYSLTTDELTFKDVCGDPQDYYGTYMADDDNYIELFADGSANLCVAGDSNDYKYSYVNNNWLVKHVKNPDIDSSDNYIVLYRSGIDGLYIFGIAPDGSLSAGEVTFSPITD